MVTGKGKGPGSPGPTNAWKPAKSRDNWLIEEKPPGNALIEEFLMACVVEDPTDEWFLELLPRVVEGFQRYDSHEARTLDEAFGVARPPGYRHAAARTRQLKQRLVQRQGMLLRDAGAIVDAAFFEVLGKVNGVKSTLASTWYYASHLKPQPRRFSTVPAVFKPYVHELEWIKR